MLRTLPYETLHFQKVGFGGKSFRAARLLSGLSQIPGFDEFFIKAVFCVLQKPGVQENRVALRTAVSHNRLDVYQRC